ncbi:putative nucleotide-diphospho-sugar transferase [Tropicibacter naphthalenivorans]|uniref:Nucleotide-diphospho-sugar transferase domain-containing protein n=1 Tax=Tropicibacter naphthalenivorans TaxID=441103 RepID=A0A0P1GQH8_9RHOB|nr:putative nucleotide-diphospho-sugar transferase [Tropicibacter naphthalenivorans]CUH77992.1 hypothetical protein TRN7648_01736 [Tropicibacter naphthalenivorans]SMC94326.1 Nucleotide-diphospho-sugar transferase [Tropicibacter naphthalenivorans]
MTKDGFVFAATGQTYIDLARRSARTLRSVMGDVQIDLFTDRPVDDPVFDRVVRLREVDHRPKMEALRRSRFQNTLYLDCDTIVVAPLTDVFDLIRRHDIVAAHEQYRLSRSGLVLGPSGPPNSFPEVNGGVLGLRKSRKTRRLMIDWHAKLRQSNFKWDQPLLRELLYRGNYRLGILPTDYNLMHTEWIRSSGQQMTAPRLLHLTRLHRMPHHSADPTAPFDYKSILAPDVAARLTELLEQDTTLLRVRGEPEPEREPTQFKYTRKNSPRGRKARLIETTRKLIGAW